MRFASLKSIITTRKLKTRGMHHTSLVLFRAKGPETNSDPWPVVPGLPSYRDRGQWTRALWKEPRSYLKALTSKEGLDALALASLSDSNLSSFHRFNGVRCVTWRQLNTTTTFTKDRGLEP